jgi:hypothetical protein
MQQKRKSPTHHVFFILFGRIQVFQAYNWVGGQQQVVRKYVEFVDTFVRLHVRPLKHNWLQLKHLEPFGV